MHIVSHWGGGALAASVHAERGTLPGLWLFMGVLISTVLVSIPKSRAVSKDSSILVYLASYVF